MTINQNFYERCSSIMVSITFTTATPRQSTKLPDAEALLATEKEADVNATVIMIPKKVDTAWRAIKRKLAVDMSEFAWPVSVAGGKTEWLVPIQFVPQVYALINAAQQQVRGLMGDFTSDWEAFKHECFKNFGDFDVPLDKFPYETAEDYVEAFKLASVTESITPGSLTALPAEVIDEVMKSSFQKLDMMLDNIRKDFIEECLSLSKRIGGDMNVTASTFNKLLKLCTLAGSIVGDSCPVIERLNTGFPSYVQRHEGEYKKFGPADTTKNEKYDPDATAKLKHTLLTTAQQLRGQMQHDPADI